MILTLQPIKHIQQCQLYASISEGVGVGGSITINSTGAGFAVVAAAGACPSVECVPKQLCSSHSQVTSGSQSNQAWAPQYLVQLFPNTGSFNSKPPLYAAASVQEIFQGEGTSDCFQKYAGKMGSSTLGFNNPSILSKALKGLGSEKEQQVSARSNQFVREVQLLMYSQIRLWGSMWVLTEIKFGMSW